MNTNQRIYSLTLCMIVLIVSSFAIVRGQSSGGSFQMTNSVVANGGGASANGQFTVEGTTAQPAAGTHLQNPPFSQTGGFWTTNGSSAPTAADGAISGVITDPQGAPVAGVVINLSGSQIRKTITDASGHYHLDDAEANGFYTVTPLLANFHFNPAVRSFSLVGAKAEAVFTAMPDPVASSNPLDTPEYFVRQQYLDLLGREPEPDGFAYWSDQINGCGNDADCVRSRRLAVAAAFFIENEFQQTGSYIYNLYEGALGRRPAFAEYTNDRALVVAGSDLEAKKQAYAESFVQRAEFAHRYETNTDAEAFVDALLRNVQTSSGVDLSGQRDSLISRYNSGTSQAHSRALVLRDLTENPAVHAANYNAAFVLTEYFGYLHRNPDAAGYTFWLNVLNNGERNNYRGMVCSFITSAEYQQRFSPVVSHTNGECTGQ